MRVVMYLTAEEAKLYRTDEDARTAATSILFSPLCEPAEVEVREEMTGDEIDVIYGKGEPQEA